MHPLGRRAALLGASAFDPRSIAGLKLWLAADRIAGLSDGDPVAAWSDLSGNGNDVTQATASKKPLYKVNILSGKPAVRFDGVDDTLAKTVSLGATTLTIIAVLKNISIVGSQPSPIAFGGSNRVQATSGNTIPIIGGSNFNGAALGTSAFKLLTVHAEGVSSILRINGVQSATGILGNYNGTGFNLADDGTTSRWANCDIAELVVYAPTISAANEVLVEKLLNTKYALY